MGLYSFKFPSLWASSKPTAEPQLAASLANPDHVSAPAPEQEPAVASAEPTTTLQDAAAAVAAISKPFSLSKNPAKQKGLSAAGKFVFDKGKAGASFLYTKVNNSSSFLSFKLSMVDFFEHVFRIAFTVTAKIVFLVRDFLIHTLSILYSTCLIPLDLVLIVAHSTLLHLAYRILDKKRAKIATANETVAAAKAGAETDPKGAVLERARHRDVRHAERQQLELENLAATRNLFWSGKPLSIRAYFMEFFQPNQEQGHDQQDEHAHSPFLRDYSVPGQYPAPGAFSGHIFGGIQSQISTSSVGPALPPRPMTFQPAMLYSSTSNRDSFIPLKRSISQPDEDSRARPTQILEDHAHKKRAQKMSRPASIPFHDAKWFNPQAGADPTGRGRSRNNLAAENYSYNMSSVLDKTTIHTETSVDAAASHPTYFESVAPLNINGLKKSSRRISGARRASSNNIVPRGAVSGTRHMSLTTEPSGSNPGLLHQGARPSTTHFGSALHAAQKPVPLFPKTSTTALSNAGGVAPFGKSVTAVKKEAMAKTSNTAVELLSLSNDLKRLLKNEETPISPPILASNGTEQGGTDSRGHIFLPKFVPGGLPSVAAATSTPKSGSTPVEPKDTGKGDGSKMTLQDAIAAANAVAIGGTNEPSSVYSNKPSNGGKGIWSNFASKMFVKTTTVPAAETGLDSTDPVAAVGGSRSRAASVESVDSLASTKKEKGKGRKRLWDTVAGAAATRVATASSSNQSWIGESDDSSDGFNRLVATNSDEAEQDSEEDNDVLASLNPLHHYRIGDLVVRRSTGREGGLSLGSRAGSSKELGKYGAVSSKNGAAQALGGPVGVLAHNAGLSLVEANVDDDVSAGRLASHRAGGLRQHLFHRSGGNNKQAHGSSVTADSPSSGPAGSTLFSHSGYFPTSPTVISLTATGVPLESGSSTAADAPLDSAATITAATAAVTAATTVSAFDENEGEENEDGAAAAYHEKHGRQRGQHMKHYGRKLASKLKRTTSRKANAGDAERDEGAAQEGEGPEGQSAAAVNDEAMWVDEASDAASIVSELQELASAAGGVTAA